MGWVAEPLAITRRLATQLRRNFPKILVGARYPNTAHAAITSTRRTMGEIRSANLRNDADTSIKHMIPRRQTCRFPSLKGCACENLGNDNIASE